MNDVYQYNEFLWRPRCKNCGHRLIKRGERWVHLAYFDEKGNTECHCGCDEPELR